MRSLDWSSAFRICSKVPFLSHRPIFSLCIPKGIYVSCANETKYEPQREKTSLLTCAPNQNSIQPAYTRSVVRDFIVRMKELRILGYPKWRFCPDCTGCSESAPGAHVRSDAFYVEAHISSTIPVSILYKSIAGRYRPVRIADGPITARYRFIKNASWYTVRFCLI